MRKPDHNPYRISVVIPAYNIKAYLSRAIDSVLDQTLPPDEIIVVDDGSTDETAAVAQQYGSQIRYIHQENAGLSAARNTGIRAATCRWIALLDGDDEWLKDKLQVQVDMLKRNPHLVWACSNCYIHRVQCNQRAMMHPSDSLDLHLAGRDTFDDYLIAANWGAEGNPDTMIIERQALLEAGLFREGLPFYEDHDMWWRIAYRWPQFGYLSQPLAIYYVDRPGSLTCDTSRARQIEVLRELINRHWSLALRAGRLAPYKIRLDMFLQGIMKKLLQENENPLVLYILNRYGSLFGVRTRIEMRLRAIFPGSMLPFFNFYHQIKQKIFFRVRGAINR